MSYLTTEQLEAICQRAEKATEGPWEMDIFDDGDTMEFSVTFDENNYAAIMCDSIIDSLATADFIANARTDIPLLLVEVARLRGRNKALNKNRNEWMTSHFEFQRKSEKFRKALETIANSDGWLIDPAPLWTTEEAYDKCVDIATEAICND